MFEGFGQIENRKSQNDINYSHDYKIIKIKTVFLFFQLYDLNMTTESQIQLKVM